jgi:DNA-binding transcriptional regulator YhcF (GntR family)
MIDLIKLDERSIVPKYLQIINSIVFNISNGNAKIGDKVPSINKLSQEFYLSRDTVERAYRVLKKRNILVSVHGKGTYIAQTQNDVLTQTKVAFIVNKLSAFKMQIYNAFLEEIGDNCQVDLHSYHCDETLFLELMEKHKSSYNYFVILPHFRNENMRHTSITDKVKKVINTIPKERLILLDNTSRQVAEDVAEIYQDFEKDIFTALELGKEKIKKYDKLVLVYPKTTFYPYPIEILHGFMKYCSQYNLNFEIQEEVSVDAVIEAKSLYITIEENDLVNLLNCIKLVGLELGKDVGIISYNDSPLKELLGITVMTSDFKAMGLRAAKMITNYTKEKINVPFYFIDRTSI